MKRFLLPIIVAFVSLLGLAVYAQNVTNPAPTAASGGYNASAPTCTSGQFCYLQTDANGNLLTTTTSSSSASAAITSIVSASAEATHVLKASAGNLYRSYATNLTNTAGFLVILDATSAPADGAITPKVCVPLPANGVASIDHGQIPGAYATGITAVITSAATCFTKTTGVITGFISGSVK